MPRLCVLILVVLVLCVLASAEQPAAAAPAANTTAPVAVAKMPSFDAPRMLADIKTLSSDEFEGRAPGSKGEELTVKYLEDAFKKIGLQPGNTDGTFVQSLPLVGITASNTPAADDQRPWQEDDVQVAR